MPRMLFSLLTIVVLGYLGVCAVLFFLQRSLIYLPQPGSPNDGPAKIVLPIADAKVLVSVRPHDGPDALIYFGGNAEDAALSLPDLSSTFPEHAVYLLHYRGYGGSTGNPSEAALFGDALVLFDTVRAKHPNIVLVGRSLGSGIAVRVASVRPATRLVLVTPFDSLQEVAAAHFPYIPVRWLLRDKYESWRYAPLVTVPTRIVAAEFDEVVPRASTERLCSRFAKGVASLGLVAGAGHNTLSDSPVYLRMLTASP